MFFPSIFRSCDPISDPIRDPARDPIGDLVDDADCPTPPTLTLWRISALIILAAMVNLIQPHSIILQHQPYHDTVQTSHSSFSLWVGWSQTACVRLRSGSFSFFLDGLVIGWCTVFTYSPISQDVKMCILTYIIIVFLHFGEDITRKL